MIELVFYTVAALLPIVNPFRTAPLFLLNGVTDPELLELFRQSPPAG